MASAELQKRKREEYEMQLFGFHSRAVNAILKNVIESKLKAQCRHLHTVISDKYKLNEEGNATLKENMKELKQIYMQRAQPHLENMQVIIEKYIKIPDNVLLEEDKCQAVQYSNEEFKELNNKLENLQKTLKRAQALSTILDKELEATKGIEKFFESTTKIFDVMEKALNYPQPDREVVHAIERYQTLKNTLENISSKSLKQIYNPSIDVQLEEGHLTNDD